MQERLIRYPAAQLLEEEEESLASADSTERYSDWWGIERYYESSTDEDDDRSEGEALQEPSSTSGRISEDSRSMTQERPMQQVSQYTILPWLEAQWKVVSLERMSYILNLSHQSPYPGNGMTQRSLRAWHCWHGLVECCPSKCAKPSWCSSLLILYARPAPYGSGPDPIQFAGLAKLPSRATPLYLLRRV